MYAARCHTGTLAACFLKGSYRSAACDACVGHAARKFVCKQGVFHHDLIELIGINLCRAEHVNKTVTEAASFAFKKRCDNKRIFAVCEIALFFYSAAVLKLHSARKLDHMNTVFPRFGIVFTQPAFD